jgi:hypothetical protein
MVYKGEMINAYKILVGKSEGTRPFRRSSCRQDDNIKMDFREVWWKGVDCMLLAQDRDHWWALVNTVMNHQVP